MVYLDWGGVKVQNLANFQQILLYSSFLSPQSKQAIQEDPSGYFMPLGILLATRPLFPLKVCPRYLALFKLSIILANLFMFWSGKESSLAAISLRFPSKVVWNLSIIASNTCWNLASIPSPCPITGWWFFRGSSLCWKLELVSLF